MMMTEIPQGWEYESGDPSVGIPEGGWIHGACQADVEQYQEPVEMLIETTCIGYGMSRQTIYRYRVTCLDCGAVFGYSVTEYDPDESYEEGNRWMSYYEERDEWSARTMHQIVIVKAQTGEEVDTVGNIAAKRIPGWLKRFQGDRYELRPGERRAWK